MNWLKLVWNTGSEIWWYCLRDIQSNLLIQPSLKTNTRLRGTILSPPKPIPIQSLLYKTTTSLVRQATTYFCLSQMKKNLSKRSTVKLCPAKKWEAVHKKWSLSDYINSIYYLIMQSLNKNWTFTFKTRSSNYPSG